MLRAILVFLSLNALILLLPIFAAAAWFRGSEDERWLMAAAACALSPFCGAVWYVLLSRPVFNRRPTIPVVFLILISGYSGIFLLLRSGVIAF